MEAKPEYQQHKDPFWWGAEHESTWVRIKDALRRDWEQTKADFGADDASDLEQGVSDTVKQAAGKQAFAKSPEAIDELEAAAIEAKREAAKVRAEARSDLNEAIASANSEYREKVADAQKKAREADPEDEIEATQEAGETIRDAAEDRRETIDEAVEDFADSVEDDGYHRDWRNVRASLRFGAGAAAQYESPAWTPDLERKLADEWTRTGSRYGWTTVRADVRRGYDNAYQTLPRD